MPCFSRPCTLESGKPQQERRSEWGLAARGAQSGRGPTTASYRVAMTKMALGGIGVSRRRTEPPEDLAFLRQGRRRFPAPAAANELPEDLAFLRQGCSRDPAPAAANELPEELAFLRQGCSRDPAPAAELSGRLFQIQKLQFSVEAGGVACEAAVSADDTVAGNDYRDGVVGHCIAHSLG